MSELLSVELIAPQKEKVSKVSIVIPVRNEASRLKRNLQILDTFLQNLKLPYEVIIVEDGSADGTSVIAKRIADQNSSMRIFTFNGRPGKGGAINRALTRTSGEIFFLMDADLAADLEYVSQLIDSVMRTNGVAIGSRLVDGAEVKRDGLRKYASKTYNLIVRCVFKTGIRDHQCGFKCFSKDVAERIIPRVRDSRWIWDTEFLIRAKMEGFIVEEVPIKWTEPKKEFTLHKILSIAPRMAYELFMLKLRHSR